MNAPALPETPLAVVEIIEDNARVRISRITWAPGSQTGWHTHAHDYVIVPNRDCRVRVETTDGTIEAGMYRDQPYSRGKGVHHNVISLEAEPFWLIEIEIKSS